MNTIITDFPPITEYELCDCYSIAEAEFSLIAQRILGRTCPGAYLFPFQSDIQHDGVIWQPDLALVAPDYSYWYVIEVEIARHNLVKHVIPQVTAFVYGVYTSACRTSLAKALNISESKAETLLTCIPRHVAVVSNNPDTTWSTKLASIGAQHLVISTYRNKVTSQAVHALAGILVPAKKSIGFGRVRAIDGAIVTHAGEYWKDGSYTIAGPAGLAEWTCAVSGKAAWLMKSRGTLEMPDNVIVQFIEKNDGSIFLRLPYA